MKLGISSYAYTWVIGVSGNIPERPLDYYGLCEKAIQLGISKIQFADNLPLDKFTDAELDRFAFRAEQNCLQLEAGARGMTEESLGKYIEIASKIGSPLLRFVIDGTGFTPDIMTIISIIKNAVGVLEKKNIILALENYERFKTCEFADIVEKVGSEQVGICLDTVNSLGAAESIDTVIETLGPLTVNLHLKEFIIKRCYHKMGYTIEGLPCGEGMLNIETLLKKVSKRCDSAILEQWVPPESNLECTVRKEDEWAKKSISYLKNFFE